MGVGGFECHRNRIHCLFDRINSMSLYTGEVHNSKIRYNQSMWQVSLTDSGARNFLLGDGA